MNNQYSMTDNEIIKALEHCSSEHLPCGRECPAWKVGCETEKYALDLINRQKAEIERLKSMNQAKLDMIHDIRSELETAKSEAIKEFAERLKASQIITHRSKEGFCVYEFDDELIDTLVEEMTEQRKEDGKNG